MSYKFNRKVVLFKIETAEGTDAAPTVGANALQVLNYQPVFMDADGKTRDIEKDYFGADPVTLANFKRGATFDMEITGSGTPGTAPQWMIPLRVCGFGPPTLVATTSATQEPITDGIPSATHWAYLSSLLLKTIGARGTVSYTITDDEIPIWSFSITGRPPETLAEDAAPGAAVITGVTDPVIASTENSTFVLDGYNVPLRSMTMAATVDLQFRSLIGPQDFMAYTDRNWNGQIVIEVPTLAAKDYFSKIRPGDTMESEFVHGKVAGNIVTIQHPKLQVTGNVTLSDEQGYTMATIPVTALPDAGNDEIVVIAE